MYISGGTVAPLDILQENDLAYIDITSESSQTSVNEILVKAAKFGKTGRTSWSPANMASFLCLILSWVASNVAYKYW